MGVAIISAFASRRTNDADSNFFKRLQVSNQKNKKTRRPRCVWPTARRSLHNHFSGRILRTVPVTSRPGGLRSGCGGRRYRSRVTHSPDGNERRSFDVRRTIPAAVILHGADETLTIIFRQFGRSSIPPVYVKAPIWTRARATPVHRHQPDGVYCTRFGVLAAFRIFRHARNLRTARGNIRVPFFFFLVSNRQRAWGNCWSQYCRLPKYLVHLRSIRVESYVMT